MRRHTRLKGSACVLLASAWLVMSCNPAYRGTVSDRTRELLGIFEEKFKNVKKNADGKIDIQLDLSHRDGLYIEGDRPYVYVTVEERAHVRLLYVVQSGEILQKFPYLAMDSEYGVQGFGSDLFDEDVRHRIPGTEDTYQYVATLPPGVDHAEEIAIVIASSVPFSKIDSLVMEKRNRISGAAGPGAPVKDNVVNLGFVLYPQSTVLAWAPLVFDLIKNLFLDRRTGYRFGYEYRVVTIRR
ncbi:DUF4384 domain-containing protein [bacterium]|nr:DUF4384 domain-containing protein [bacterium]